VRSTGVVSTPAGLSPRYRHILQPDVLEELRRRLHDMNRWMMLMWRIGLGRFAEAWPAGFGRIMVIEHVGRRTGARYRTPVNFTRCGPDLFCLAGFGPRTDWYRNVLAHPEIAVWLPHGRWTAKAEEASDSPDRLALMRRVLCDSGFASRAIGLDPRVVSDEVLDDATAGYLLLKITPLEREDAPDGPGDLAWVWWPLAAALALGWWLLRRG
jgi:deazaflavin-dependent oxidoreductase (nitroreductase family)